MADPRTASLRADGRGSVDSADLWNGYNERIAALDRNKARTHGYGAGSASAIGMGIVDLGTLVLGPVSVRTGVVSVALCYTWVEGGARIHADLIEMVPPEAGRQVAGLGADDFQEAGGRTLGSSTVLVTLSAAVATATWVYGTVTLPPDRAEDQVFAVRFWSDGYHSGGADANGAALTIAAFEASSTTDDEGTSIIAWPNVRLAAWSTADRPDDVYRLDRLDRQLSHVENMRRRPLGQHSLLSGVSASAQSFRYLLVTGPQLIGATAWVYLSSSNANAPSIEVFIDGVSAGSTTGAATTDGQWISRAVASGALTANTTHEVKITVTPGAGATLTVTGLGVYDADEYTGSDFSADTMPTRRQSPTTVSPGDAILAATTGGSLSGVSFFDRATTASNALFVAASRAQHHVADVPGQGAAATSAAAASPATLYRAKHLVSRGVDTLLLWACVDTHQSVASVAPGVVFAATGFSLPETGATFRSVFGCSGVWIFLGSLAVTEETIEDLAITCYVNDTSASKGSLRGVHLVEIPREDSAIVELMAYEDGTIMAYEDGTAMAYE